MTRDWTVQENHKRLNNVLVFIEKNINEKLTLDQLAHIACLSPYHFHRIFTAYIGESLYDYIKRLRLEGAAFKLRYSRESISEISTTYGYDQLASFSKAFKQHFGKAPSVFRKLGRPHEKQHDESTKISVRFEQLNDTEVVFVREMGEYRVAAKKAWQTLMPLAYQHNLITDSTKAIGISYDSPEITDYPHIRYDACIVSKTAEKLPGVVGKQIIEGGHYAIFRHTGPYEQMENLYRKIYEQWLPESNKQLRDSPSFCHFHQVDSSMVPASQLVTDIYIPLKD